MSSPLFAGGVQWNKLLLCAVVVAVAVVKFQKMTDLFMLILSGFRRWSRIADDVISARRRYFVTLQESFLSLLSSPFTLT